MSTTPKSRLVYATGPSPKCPKCGWPASDCRCSSSHAAEDEAVPAKITAKLRVEKGGRGGKTVTVIDGLPRNAAFLKELAAELKRACGTGGAVRDGAVELQGDARERVRDLLGRKGYAVKG